MNQARQPNGGIGNLPGRPLVSRLKIVGAEHDDDEVQRHVGRDRRRKMLCAVDGVGPHDAAGPVFAVEVGRAEVQAVLDHHVIGAEQALDDARPSLVCRETGRWFAIAARLITPSVAIAVDQDAVRIGLSRGPADKAISERPQGTDSSTNDARSFL